MGIYPNRGVIDAAFSLLRDGQQRSVFASGPLPLDRSQTTIGPISIEVVEPLRATRVRVDADHLGITADLLWEPRTIALEEPRQTLVRANHTFLDSTRFTQWGTWKARSMSTVSRSTSVGTATAGRRIVRGARGPWAIRCRRLPRVSHRVSRSSGRPCIGRTGARMQSSSRIRRATGSRHRRRRFRPQGRRSRLRHGNCVTGEACVRADVRHHVAHRHATHGVGDVHVQLSRPHVGSRRCSCPGACAPWAGCPRRSASSASARRCDASVSHGGSQPRSSG